MRAPEPPPESGRPSRPSPSGAGGRADDGPPEGENAATPSPAGTLPSLDLLGSIWHGRRAVYVLDGRWIVEAWNPAAEVLWGILSADAVGRHLDDLIDWRAVSGPGRDIGRVGRQEGAWSERRLDRPRSGSRRDERIVVDVDIAAERDAGGEISRFIVSSRDVTRAVDLAAQMSALAALGTAGGELRDRQAVARDALEILRRTTGADDGIVAMLQEGRYETFAEINADRLKGMAAMIDTSTSPLLSAIATPGLVLSGDPGTMPLHDDIKARIGSIGLRWMVATAIWSGDALAGLLALGWIRELPAEPAEPPTLEAATHLSATLENARLVEELRVRYEAIEASAQRYRTLFMDAPEAYVVTTADGVITDMNPHAEELYRTTPGSLVGRHVTELADMDPAEFARRDAAMLQDGQATFVGVGRRPDGSAFAQQLNVRRILLDGEDRNLVHIRDTTEADRLQAELLQAQKMDAVGQLVAGVAHELNNPLQAIIGFSKLLGNDPRLPADLRSDAGLLVAEATRTKRIVENLLNFARHRPPERYPTRLGMLVQSILDLQSYQFSSDAITVEVDIPDDLPPVPLDRAMMQQVVLNLTANAIQAIRGSRGRGTIRISASADHDADGAPVARLAVADTGPGVREEHRDRLFLPFFTTKAPGEGTGLGLSVSFGIVAGHGGRLWFEPGADGGSVFTFELPMEPSAPGGPLAAVVLAPARSSGAGPVTHVAGGDRPTPDGGTAPRRLRILVLDDEEAIRAFLVRVLGRAVDVVTAGTGTDALRLIAEDDFDGMFCDYRMAGMSGTEVYLRVAELRPGLARHFILMSGDVLNPELLAFAEGRSVRLLSKPFEIETLQAIIDEMASDIVGSPG